MPFARLLRLPGDLDRLRAERFMLIAMTPAVDAVEIGEFAARVPGDVRMAVLIGHEGNGLSSAAQAKATARVRISMVAAADSVNVATAAGMALHLFARRRNAL